jgi:hypothetical protein
LICACNSLIFSSAGFGDAMMGLIKNRAVALVKPPTEKETNLSQIE